MVELDFSVSLQRPPPLPLHASPPTPKTFALIESLFGAFPVRR